MTPFNIYANIGGEYYGHIEKKRKKFSDILDMQRKKTGKLFNFCCFAPGVIAKKKIEELKSLSKLGEDIGLLFQLADDFLDIKGSKKLVGKLVKKDIKKGVKAPLNLVYCKKCQLLQLEHSAPQEIMYKKFYWYKSGITKTMREGLKELYKDIKKNCKIKSGDVILDIGANDGTLLKYFKKSH